MKKKSIRIFLFFASLLAFDLAVKALVYFYVNKIDWLHTTFPFGGIAVFENLWGGVSFAINHVENKGAAWGMLASFSSYLLVVRLLAAISLVIYLRYSLKENIYRLPLLFILTGAAGNIMDHFIYGKVIDMFHFIFWGYSFPVFNLADVYICIGIAGVFYLSVLRRQPKEKLC